MIKNKTIMKKSAFKFSYIIVLLGISVFVLAWYSNILKNELRELVRNTLVEVSNQNVLVIQKEIEGDLNALTEIAEHLSDFDNNRDEEAMDVLNEIAERYSFLRMGYCWADGLAYKTDDSIQDITDNDGFVASMQGETYIDGPLTDPESQEQIIVFSTPIKKNDNVIGVAFSTYQVSELKKTLFVSSFGGAGYTYIVQRDGSKVVDSMNITSFQNMTNVFKSMEEASNQNEQAIDELRNLLENGRTGLVTFHNKVDKYMYATPLGINDWYLLDVVPVDFMDSTSDSILRRTYLICMILAAVCAVIAVLVLNEERRKKKQMQNLLYVDDLTGGNTVAKFKIDVAEKLEEHRKNTAFVMMDLNDFKLINELFGYEEGDRVICYIWKTLQDNCREEECAGRIVADRFNMMLYFESKDEAEMRIIKIAEEIRRFVIPSASEYILHPAFGIYYMEQAEEDIEDILNCTALAHNLAKQDGDSIYKVYNDVIKDRMLEKKQLSDQIEHACQNREFVVYYQPKYESKTKKLEGAEALVRWKRPDGQMISPGLFIPLAEESGFVRKLDEYVFREVCLAQKRWLDKGMKIVPISVNLSRRHLENPEFIEEYKKILEESGVPIEYVQLEITESAMTEKKEESLEIMEKLHSLGFRILMDDFGTGYSSLMMLKSVPVDVMKLDKSFVDDYDDERGEQIIRCVMNMAQNLQISITAEGVETEDQYIFLNSIGCDTIQGYYFARPMPEEEFESSIRLMVV